MLDYQLCSVNVHSYSRQICITPGEDHFAAATTPMLRGLAAGQREWALLHFFSLRYTVRLFTPRCHLSAYFANLGACLAFGAQYPAAPLRSTPLSGANPSRRSHPSPSSAHYAPCVLSIPPPVFFTGAHKRPTRPFDCDACNYMLGALSRSVLDRVVRRISLAAMMYKMSAGQFDLVYNSLSFTLASMMAPEPKP